KMCDSRLSHIASARRAKKAWPTNVFGFGRGCQSGCGTERRWHHAANAASTAQSQANQAGLRNEPRRCRLSDEQLARRRSGQTDRISSAFQSQTAENGGRNTFRRQFRASSHKRSILAERDSANGKVGYRG